jgi:hypothetical protein
MKSTICILFENENNLPVLLKIHGIDKRAWQIMSEIKQIPVFENSEIHHTNGTNAIFIRAVLSRQEIEFYSKDIKNIPNVLYVLNYHNHINGLKEAAKIQDYFKVFAYSSTLLEFYAKEILIKHLDITKEEEIEEIEDLTFKETISNLKELELINEDLFNNINYVRDKRNKFIHQSLRKDIATLKDIQDIETLSDLAIDSTSKIITVHENIHI